MVAAHYSYPGLQQKRAESGVESYEKYTSIFGREYGKVCRCSNVFGETAVIIKDVVS